ncbi:MAG: hypothetical protein LBS81_01135 [Endomicrobium sp.]|jgi:hypothetical protein|nr:hypothetical protein [Endomicrobium sp.]
MIKKMLALMFVVFSVASLAFAAKSYVVDTPSSGILSYGSYTTGFRFFSNGGIISKINFGVFKLLNIGLSWELDQFVGDKQVKVATPTLQVKLRVYEGNMILPVAAIGYDGQGYFFDPGEKKYLQKDRGLYFVVGREFFIEGLMFNVGININAFLKPKLYGFVNATALLYKEAVYFMAEYDNIGDYRDTRLNLGLRFAFTEYIDADCIIRDCWGKDDKNSRISNERIFKVNYYGKF